MSLGDESLEWQSILNALRDITVETAHATLGERGTVVYTDGACIKNPGGPAGWSVILVAAENVIGDNIRENAPRIESYGHIPKSPNTTNNRAEIAAVLAALCIAPRDQPLTIFSDSEYTIKVAQGVSKCLLIVSRWIVLVSAPTNAHLSTIWRSAFKRTISCPQRSKVIG